jgi:hypothetical protein
MPAEYQQQKLQAQQTTTSEPKNVVPEITQTNDVQATTQITNEKTETQTETTKQSEVQNEATVGVKREAEEKDTEPAAKKAKTEIEESYPT